MRAGGMVALGMVMAAAGCTFDVIGTYVDPNAPPSSPTQSVPSGDTDAGAPATQPAPPMNPAGPDMAQQRIGTACTTDAQCDPGLTCGKTFGAGPGKVDIPGGYCTLDCSKNACPTGSVCVTFTFGKFCESDCPPDPCRTGYTCCTVSQDESKACTPSTLCPKGGG